MYEKPNTNFNFMRGRFYERVRFTTELLSTAVYFTRSRNSIGSEEEVTTAVQVRSDSNYTH